MKKIVAIALLFVACSKSKDVQDPIKPAPMLLIEGKWAFVPQNTYQNNYCIINHDSSWDQMGDKSGTMRMARTYQVVSDTMHLWGGTPENKFSYKFYLSKTVDTLVMRRIPDGAVSFYLAKVK